MTSTSKWLSTILSPGIIGLLPPKAAKAIAISRKLIPSVSYQALPQYLALCSKGRQAQDQQDQEYHHEDIEQETRDIRARGCDAGKAEQRGHQRDHQEYQRPPQERHGIHPCLSDVSTNPHRPGSEL